MSTRDAGPLASVPVSLAGSRVLPHSHPSLTVGGRPCLTALCGVVVVGVCGHGPGSSHSTHAPSAASGHPGHAGQETGDSQTLQVGWATAPRNQVSTMLGSPNVDSSTLSLTILRASASLTGRCEDAVRAEVQASSHCEGQVGKAVAPRMSHTPQTQAASLSFLRDLTYLAEEENKHNTRTSNCRARES